MASSVRTRALGRPRRLSLLKKDRKGVASTVGTIMALLVFLTFMSLIINNYVPAWMLDNERSHMNAVIDQFGQLKGDVDGMITQQRMTGDNSMKLYAPITLGASGVPIFASPTAGILKYEPQGSNVTGLTVQFSYTTTGADVTVSVNGGGKVELYAPNRYYVEQWIAYENGAILLRQTDGQTVRAYPNLDITKTSTSVNVAFTQIDLIGAAQSLTGADSVGFSLDLIYIDAQTYTVGGDHTWKLTMTTTYPQAWMKYLNETLAEEGLVSGTDYTLIGPTVLASGASIIGLTLNGCGQVTYNRAYVSMSLLTS